MRIKEDAREGNPAPSRAERDVADELFTSAVHTVNPSAKSVVNVDKAKNNMFVVIIGLVRVAPDSDDDASDLLRLLGALYRRLFRRQLLIRVVIHSRRALALGKSGHNILFILILGMSVLDWQGWNVGGRIFLRPFDNYALRILCMVSHGIAKYLSGTSCDNNRIRALDILTSAGAATPKELPCVSRRGVVLGDILSQGHLVDGLEITWFCVAEEQNKCKMLQTWRLESRDKGKQSEKTK